MRIDGSDCKFRCINLQALRGQRKSFVKDKIWDRAGHLSVSPNVLRV